MSKKFFIAKGPKKDKIAVIPVSNSEGYNIKTAEKIRDIKESKPAILFENRYMYTQDGGMVIMPDSTTDVMNTMININSTIAQDIYDSNYPNGARSINEVYNTCYHSSYDILYGQFRSVVINLTECFYQNVREIIGANIELTEDRKLEYCSYRFEFIDSDSIIHTAIAYANDIGSRIYNNVNFSISRYVGTITTKEEFDRVYNGINTINNLFRILMANLSYEASVFAHNVKEFNNVFGPIRSNVKSMNSKNNDDEFCY